MMKTTPTDTLSKIFIIFLLSYFNPVNAQVFIDYNDAIKQYTLASPEVYNFEKYSLNPINHYVGKPEISVPIYTIKTGDINYPLNLVYDAGGIKVDQLASDVGLGWNLTKCMITRTVNHDNDFDNMGSLILKPNYASYSEIDKQKDSQARTLHNYSGKVGYFLQKLTNQKLTDLFRSVDFIPDTYNFYSSSFSTKFFFIDKNTPQEINPKGTKVQGIASERRIETYKGYHHPFNGSWEDNYDLLSEDFFTIKVTTPDGLVYTFSDCEYAITEDLTEGYMPINSPAQVSAWHITKIEDTKSDKKIEFIYEDNTLSNPHRPNQGFYMAAAQRSYQYLEGPDNQPPSCFYYVPNDYDGFATYKLQKSARIDILKKRLRKIIFDEGEVYFNYNNEGIGSTNGSGRNDVYGADYVSQIYVKDKNGTVIKSFNLIHSVFNSDFNVGEFNPDNNLNNTYRYKRLKLYSIQEEGKRPYKFFYDETIKLPPVNSFSVDFLGYYNNSQDATTESVILTTRPNPTLYYYPNNFELSLLPFPVPNMSATVIPGIFNRQANSYAKAWSLNKIEYPTGGYSQFTYEPNQFELFNQNITGGGIRIASQILNDGLGNTRTITYTYLKDNGITSSGKLSSIPYFGHPTKKFFTVSIDYQEDPPVIISGPIANINTSNWKLFDKSNLTADITSGAYVGYSRVSAIESGNGRKEYKFTSNDEYKDIVLRHTPALGPHLASLNGGGSTCMIDFIIANSGLGANLFTDNSYKRGKLLEEKVYNESNQLVKKDVFTYSDVPISYHTFHQAITQPIWTQGEDNLGSFMTIRKTFNIRQFLKTSSTEYTYDHNGQEKSITSNMTYNANGLLKTLEVMNSNNNLHTKKVYYATDVNSTTSLPGGSITANQLAIYQAMTGPYRNNISEPVQIEEYVNNTLMSTVRRTYNIFDPVAGYVRPESIKISKGNNPLIDKLLFTKYENATGNPVEFTQNGELKTILIWGYNKTNIIAKIENSSYSAVQPYIANLQALSNTEYSTSSEANLRTALNSMRTTLPNAMITTYTHDPLIGIKSITDANGFTTFYEYDTNGRLVSVKDNDGNFLSTNEYHYKN